MNNLEREARRAEAHVRPVVTRWIDEAQVDSSANPIPNLHNVLLALRHDPHWRGQFRFDQMLRAVVQPDDPLEDIHLFRVHEWMQANGLPRLAIEPVREAIDIVAHEHVFHPIRHRLSELEPDWDGQARTPTWLATYLGADDNDYHRTVGPLFLIAMVARIFQPGCKSDYMLVLEGPQGELKSEVCRILAGDKYFSETLPDIGADHVRVSMHLRGKWLIEISELSAFSKADAAKLKAFITTREEQYLPKFAHNEVREPRQCLFVGTTNDDTYLRDATGGRRFWPVKCGAIDIASLRRDRDQLLAEAVHAFNMNAQWWPDRNFERMFIKPVQDSRYDADAWEDPVRLWLVGKSHVSLMEVAEGALAFQAARFSIPDQRRLANILRSMGWQLRRSKSSRLWEAPRHPSGDA